MYTHEHATLSSLISEQILPHWDHARVSISLLHRQGVQVRAPDLQMDFRL
jgi:hypothetical protein